MPLRTAPIRPSPTSTNGSSAGTRRVGAYSSWLKPVPTGRKGGMVVVGVAVLLLGAVLGAMALRSAGSGRAVLALARDLSPGQALAPEDLKVARVSDPGLAAVRLSDAPQLYGRSAPTRLPAGTLLTRDQFSSGPALAAGQTVLGVSLTGAQVPSSELKPGDRVMVVRTPAPGQSGPGADAASVLVPSAEVTEVLQGDDDKSVKASLVVAVGDVPAVAGAAATNRVSLVVATAS